MPTLSLLIMVAVVVFTFALDRAMLAGFLIYIAGALAAGKVRELNPYLLFSAGLLLAGTVFSA